MRGEFTRGLWVVAYREWMRLLRDRARMSTSLLMPLLFFAVFGAGLSRSIGGLAPGVDFVQFLFPGIVAQTVFMTSIFSGLSVVWDREFGFLKELLVAPISRVGIVGGKVLGGGGLALVQATIMLALAPVVHVQISVDTLLRVVPLLLLVSGTVSSLGILIASGMRSQQGFQMLMQLLILPMIVLSGAFFPINNVPDWLAVLARLNPFTYGVDAIRQAFLLGAGGAGALETASPLGLVVLGHPMTLWEDAVIIAIAGAVLLTLATLAFARQE
jgi:ABC-2 type transport system permease protein